MIHTDTTAVSLFAGIPAGKLAQYNREFYMAYPHMAPRRRPRIRRPRRSEFVFSTRNTMNE